MPPAYLLALKWFWRDVRREARSASKTRHWGRVQSWMVVSCSRVLLVCQAVCKGEKSSSAAGASCFADVLSRCHSCRSRTRGACGAGRVEWRQNACLYACRYSSFADECLEVVAHYVISCAYQGLSRCRVHSANCGTSVLHKQRNKVRTICMLCISAVRSWDCARGGLYRQKEFLGSNGGGDYFWGGAVRRNL